MKYLIVKIDGKEKPVLFPCDLTHSSVAHNLGFGREKLVSAGFVGADKTGKISCGGKSLSLSLRSRKKDAGVIIRELK